MYCCTPKYYLIYNINFILIKIYVNIYYYNDHINFVVGFMINFFVIHFISINDNKQLFQNHNMITYLTKSALVHYKNIIDSLFEGSK
jgi:hypothetical protein